MPRAAAGTAKPSRIVGANPCGRPGRCGDQPAKRPRAFNTKHPLTTTQHPVHPCETPAQTTTTGLTSVPILSIEMLTTSPSANVNSGGGIVPVPVQTVVPFGTRLCRCNQSAK